MKLTLTDRFCERAKPGEWFDDKATGLSLRVGKTRRTWHLHYSRAGKRGRALIGTYPAISLSAARRAAIETKDAVEAGRNPTKATTVGAMLDKFTERYVIKDAKLRTADYVKDVIERLVKPEIGGVALNEIKRSHVVRMLDTIADTNGPVMADRTLAIVRKAFNWQASRDDDFVPPIAKGMGRTKPKERARERVLSDEEIRAVWSVADGAGVFGRYLKFLLLTATRRGEAAQATRAELREGLWTIPAERMKGKAEHVVPLPPATRDLIADTSGDFLFTTDGTTPISGFSKFKRAFDRQVEAREGKPLPNWTLHDLRRTARSLLSRAGVSADIAERCLAHVIPGVRGVYDRYEYLEEKRQAFEALAAQIDRIVNPPSSNVVALTRGSHG
jgi:integrase